jgi:hypothetical protein
LGGEIVARSFPRKQAAREAELARDGDERPAAQRAMPADEAQHEVCDEERLRRAARAYFRAAPPYRIQFEEDGRLSLRKKHYRYWGEADPAASTQWRVLSYHEDFEAAERRLRHVTSANVYYDEQGRLARAPREPAPDWDVPEDEE